MWSDYYEPKLYVYGAAAGRVTAMEGEAPSAPPSVSREHRCQQATMTLLHHAQRNHLAIAAAAATTITTTPTTTTTTTTLVRSESYGERL